VSSRRYTIACLAGDGVGPELTAEASRVLAVVSRLHGFGITELHLPFGGEALVRFGHRLPLGTQSDLGRADAVLVASPGEPAFQLVKAALAPVCSLTRVAHGAQSTLVVGPSAATGEVEAIRESFLLASRRRARLSSVGDSGTWSDLVDAEAAADARGIDVRHRSFSEALASFQRGEHLDVVAADEKLHGALADALAALSKTVDLTCRGWLSDTSPGLFAPVGVVDPTVAGYGVVDPAAMLLAVSLLLAAGLREHAAAKTLERAVVAAAAAGYASQAAPASSLAATTRTFTDAVIARMPESRTDVELVDEVSP
jgi:3-isopropylmalate dehydrogenase